MSDTPLAGKNALVTGAAHRTGRDLALGLARAGADVAIHFHTNEAAAREVVTEIQGLGRRALAIPADLTDADQANNAVQAVETALGSVDLLVNNVGVIVWKTLDEITPEDWQRCIDGTATATWNTSRAAACGMRARGFGRIINILDADADALAPVIFATPYKIGKTATWVLTKSMAKNEAAHGITVNAISPGVLENSEKEVPLERIPAGRPGTSEDLIGALLYLCSDTAAHTTGTNIKVSGGYLI